MADDDLNNRLVWDGVTQGSAILRFHMAEFAEHFADPATTEVVINKPGEFGVESGGTFKWYKAPKLTFDKIDGIAKVCAGLSRQTLDVHSPRASSWLPGPSGRLRVQLARPPAVLDGTYSVTIRKRATDFVPTLIYLDEHGYFDFLPQDRNWANWWRNQVLMRRTILIGAPTGAGKTTFAEALAREIPEDDRVVTVEKTPEWNLPHRNLVTALYGSYGDGKEAERAATQCVEDSLRMRPDRILVGELRSGGEAWAYMRALLAGHPGGITTIHAESTEGVSDALAMMLRQDTSAATMQDADLRAQVGRCVHIIAHCARSPYRLTAVEELAI